MAWVSLGVAALAAISLIALLGAPIAWALRARGFALAVITVPAAFAVVAISSIIAPFARFGWSLVAPVAVTAALTIILFALRRVILPRLPAPQSAQMSGARDLWLGIGAAAIGGAVIALSLIAGLGTGNAISQTFDAGFHLNAVRYILDTATASPFSMDLTTPGNPVFYPTLWHGFVALIIQLTGVSIPVATNALLFTASAVMWPLGAVALGRAVAGPSRTVTLVSGAAAAAFPNFPLFLAGYGVIYPNILSLALMPYLVVAGLLLLNLGPARRALPIAPAGRWLLLIGSFGAAVLAHPNVIHAFIVWGFVPVVWAAVRAIRGSKVPGINGLPETPRTPLWVRRCIAVAGLIALTGATVAAWILGRTTDNDWEGFYGPRSAALQLLGGTPHLEGHAWVVSAVLLVGVIVVWRRRHMRWLLGSAALLALFYLISDGFPTADWRTFFLSPWYNDPRRLASLVPFGALPLLVIGAVSMWAIMRPGLLRLARQRPAEPRSPGASPRPTRTRRLLAAFALLAFVAVGQAGALAAAQAVRLTYDPAESILLSEDERTLLERLDERVPEGEVVANNPLNGSALAYALASRAVLFPHANGAYGQPGYDFVDELVAEPAQACEVSAAIDVHYVLDFGTNYVFESDTPRAAPFKRMKDLDQSPVLTEVDREGDAVLYRVEGC